MDHFPRCPVAMQRTPPDLATPTREAAASAEYWEQTILESWTGDTTKSGKTKQNINADNYIPLSTNNYFHPMITLCACCAWRNTRKPFTNLYPRTTSNPIISFNPNFCRVSEELQFQAISKGSPLLQYLVIH